MLFKSSGCRGGGWLGEGDLLSAFHSHSIVPASPFPLDFPPHGQSAFNQSPCWIKEIFSPWGDLRRLKVHSPPTPKPSKCGLISAGDKKNAFGRKAPPSGSLHGSTRTPLGFLFYFIFLNTVLGSGSKQRKPDTEPRWGETRLSPVTFLPWPGDLRCDFFEGGDPSHIRPSSSPAAPRIPPLNGHRGRAGPVARLARHGRSRNSLGFGERHLKTGPSRSPEPYRNMGKGGGQVSGCSPLS